MKLKINIHSLLFWSFILFTCNACVNKKRTDDIQQPARADFEIRDFDALTNCNDLPGDTLRILELDYTDAITNGFVIPSSRQKDGGKFICSFKIKNTAGSSQSFFYKIYYQNESYKFPETDSTLINMNPYSSENFYGSWDDTLVLFKKTGLIPPDGQFHEITDSIQITGNPRFEKIYISNGSNDRWKRNPRVGIYSFLLAVTTNENLEKKNIPSGIQNISIPENNYFVSPYYFFNYGKGKSLVNTRSIYSSSRLKVIARPDLSSGIYINSNQFKSADIKKHYTDNCGNDSMLFRQAAFSQFIHYIDESTRMDNIPVVSDVLKDNYTKREYNWNSSFYRKEERISGTPMTASSPCETVFSDPVNKKIVILNPKTTYGKWRKENTGVISRHGLCYGKIRVKAKLTELLNKDNVWNGITNAIWMINQPDENGWNLRRPCKKEGYFSTYWGGKDDKRVDRTGYSEIDFEILKTPPNCPESRFPPVYNNPTSNPHDIESWDKKMPDEILQDDGNITVACTNWDMACWEPANFDAGCNTITYANKQFEAHRWDHWYRAITEKQTAPDDLLFGSPYFYFEIEWKPTEIIWRIGPEPNQMKVVGYMNDQITSVPNNQMLLIITQEFHNTQWWPGSPYQQKNIPFPSNDIVGEIYEVVIE